MNARRDGGAGLGISWLLIYFTVVHFSFLTFWVRKWGLTISVLGWILNIWRKTRNDRGKISWAYTQLTFWFTFYQIKCVAPIYHFYRQWMIWQNCPFKALLLVLNTSYVAVSVLPLSFPCKLLTQKKLKWDLERHSLTIRFLKYIPPTDLTKSDYTSRSCFWEEVEAKIEGEFVIDREQLTHVLTPSYKLPNILISCSSMWTTPASLSAAPPLFGRSWMKPATSHVSWVNHDHAHDQVSTWQWGSFLCGNAMETRTKVGCHMW